MKDKDTPLKLVRLWSKMAPDAYDKLEDLRFMNVTGVMEWPRYCELPISAAYTYLSVQHKFNDAEAATLAAELTACYLWRRNKVIYQIDEELGKVLVDQAEDMEDTDVLPMDFLMRLPYPCVYVKAPYILDFVDGFWAWIEYDMDHKRAELRIQWVMEDFQHSLPSVLHLLQGKTLGECIADTLSTTAENLGKPIEAAGAGDSRAVLSAIQMLLYLVSENADLVEQAPELTHSRTPKKKVAHLIEDKASEVKGVDVGVRISSALRKARVRYEQNPDTVGTGNKKAAHMRRGHWHHYWTGPLTGQRELVLKWTAPTVIHPEDGLGDNVVVFPVK